jgi:hypothetical protein
MIVVCILSGVARSTITYKPVPEDPQALRIKRILNPRSEVER